MAARPRGLRLFQSSCLTGVENKHTTSKSVHIYFMETNSSQTEQLSNIIFQAYVHVHFRVHKHVRHIENAYMSARRYGIFLREFNAISHDWAQWTSEILISTFEEKFQISKQTCIIFVYYINILLTRTSGTERLVLSYHDFSLSKKRPYNVNCHSKATSWNGRLTRYERDIIFYLTHLTPEFSSGNIMRLTWNIMPHSKPNSSPSFGVRTKKPTWFTRCLSFMVLNRVSDVPLALSNAWKIIVWWYAYSQWWKSL